MYKTLIDEKFQQFTVSQLKTAYQEEYREETNKNASQMVHRTLRRLIANELLTKQHDNGKLVYLKTSKFSPKLLSPKLLSPSKPKQVTKSAVQPLIESGLNHKTSAQLDALQSTLNQYQVNLLSSIGEAEEFKRLCDSIPQARARLYPRYMTARNHSSTLTGKIKALEAGIAELKSL
ncbi:MULTISPECIES: hypothetical protein [unclassified Agarivorans]|uniref:hypothetical protein n=1 Tax=unclassified Agarivorans TaxID=2636026 RepID=UPI0026E1D734|nr:MULTISPECIES: hypothetical protein [unclassified Agarivorans]MDO6717734.1 hypothetical protein [Agarivorans sp. 2_MG-2023]